jgi:hypothetical protein
MHVNHKRKFYAPPAITLLLFGGAVAGLYLRQPVWFFHRQDLKTGKKIISKVETFRKNYNRLPENLKEVGIDDPDLRVFYHKMDKNEYCVWFGTTLGESEAYTSSTRKWGNPSCY